MHGTGARIVSYIPDFAFKVRMTASQRQTVQELDSVAWVGLFHPAYKLSPGLNRNGRYLYTVRIEEGVDVSRVAAAVADTGAQVLSRDGNVLQVAVDSTLLDAIARVPDVAWVENFVPRMMDRRFNRP